MSLLKACGTRTLKIRPFALRGLHSLGIIEHRSDVTALPTGVCPFDRRWRPNVGQHPVAFTTAQPFWAAGNAKRSFHGSNPAEGYKSGPRRPSWKYVNVQTAPLNRTVPKPPPGTQLPRFYVPAEVIREAKKGSVFQLNESETKHALRALRMGEGDWLEVCDGKGTVVEAQMRGLTYSNKAFATAATDPVQVPWDGPKWEVVVALGGLQGNRADTMVEKISEVGAWSLRPLLTHRSRTIGKFEEKDTVRIVEVEELSDASDLEEEDDFLRTGRFGRWERVAIAAGKQCLRASSLLMRPPCTLDQLLPQIEAGTPALVAKQGAPPLQQVLEDSMDSLRRASEEASPSKPCLLLIGPEGDFTEEEMKRLEAAGAKPVGLGRNRLRVETAAIAIVTGAVLQYDSVRHRSAGQTQELAA